MNDEEPSAPPSAPEPAPPEPAPPVPRKRTRHAEFFAALFAVFIFGWAASYIGTERHIEWLYFAGLGLVALPLLIFVAWLGH